MTLYTSIQKTLLLLLVCMTFLSAAQGQSFEGVITYTIDIALPDSFMGFDRATLLKGIKSKSEWSSEHRYIYGANGNYRLELNDSSKTYSIYKPELNKIYSLTPGAEFCVVSDVSKDLGEKWLNTSPTIKLLDTTYVVNSKVCKVVRVDWNGAGHTDYIFAEGYLPADPEMYKGYKAEGWYGYLQIAKALPVMIIRNAMGMATSFTLVSAVPSKVDASLFEIPKLKAPKKKASLSIASYEIFEIKK